jgi:autotransporter-associated beta strand protein
MPGNPAVITGTNIALTVPIGTDVTNLAPTFTLSPGATCIPVSGSVRNFTTHQVYTVTSSDSLAATVYTVAVDLRPAWINDGSGLWSATSNWGNGIVANGSGLTADFSSIDVTADRTVSLDSPRTIGNLIFGDAAPASAAGWILSNNGTAANILTLAGGTPTITVNALGTGKDATISAQIAGSVGLTKSGPGTLTLANSNTYTGDTVIEAGVLRLGGTSGSAGTGNVFNSGTLALNNIGTVTLSTMIYGSGNLRQEGPGTVLLSGANSFTGGTVVNGGTLAVDGASQVQNRLAPNSLVTLNNPGSIFEIRGGNALPTGESAVDVTANADTILRIVSGGSTATASSSSGTSHAHLHNLTLNAATIDLAYSGWGDAYLGQSFALNGDITVGGSAMSTIQFGSGGTAATAGIALIGSNIFTVNDGVAGTDLVVSAELEGDGGFTKTGAGTLLLSGTNTHTGLTTVSAGTLVLSGNNSAARGGITISGGIAQFNSLNSFGGTGRNVTVNSGGTVVFGPSLGAASIPAALNRIVSSSAGVIAVDNYASTNFNLSTAGLTNASLGALGNVTYTGTLTPNGTTYRLGGGSGTLTVVNPLSGNGRSLVVNGSVILQAANTYTGDTTVSNGTLTLADNAALKFIVTDTSNNRLTGTGTGTATLNGDFSIDTSAVTVSSGSWTLVDVTTLLESCGSTFTVTGGNWSELSDVWTMSEPGRIWTFTESTGILSLSGPPPAVTTGPASGITALAATITGTVNPNGLTTSAQFEYGLTTAYGGTASVTLVPADGATAQDVSASISGLLAGETYHYRLTATNSNGTTLGEDMTFVNAVPFAYTSANGMVTIAGFTGVDQDVSIPGTISGMPVTRIGNFAFYNRSSVTRITLPASVTSIGDFAFAACGNLANITLPSGLTGIGDFAFYDCNSLTNITIPAGVTHIGSYAFAFCGNLTSVTISDGVTSLGDGAFYRCDKLANVTLPASVTRIGESAFERCTGLANASFLGNAPGMGVKVFASTASGFTVGYFDGATGITSPTWLGYPVLNMGAATPLATWLLGKNLPYNANPQDDPNGDGVNLLLAYALNLDPNQNLSGSLPRPVCAAGRMSLRYYAGNDGLTYTVETSSNLTNWSSAGVTVSGPDADKFRTASVPMTGPRYFLRLGVSNKEELSPLATWLLAHGFPATANPQDDPNGDGVNLLLAYALNLDPRQNLSGSLPRPVLAGNQMNLPFFAGSDGVTYTVEASSDLQTWSPTGVSVSAQDTNKFRTATINITGPRRFLRLVVSAP